MRKKIPQFLEGDEVIALSPWNNRDRLNGIVLKQDNDNTCLIETPDLPHIDRAIWVTNDGMQLVKCGRRV